MPMIACMACSYRLVTSPGRVLPERQLGRPAGAAGWSPPGSQALRLLRRRLELPGDHHHPLGSSRDQGGAESLLM